MLESARRLARPRRRCRASTIDTAARSSTRPRPSRADLPVWVGELYLEFHRGTYTTQAAIKRGNRRAEFALRAAELWCGATGAGCDRAAYPADELDEAVEARCCSTSSTTSSPARASTGSTTTPPATTRGSAAARPTDRRRAQQASSARRHRRHHPTRSSSSTRVAAIAREAASRRRTTSRRSSRRPCPRAATRRSSSATAARRSGRAAPGGVDRGRSRTISPRRAGRRRPAHVALRQGPTARSSRPDARPTVFQLHHDYPKSSTPGTSTRLPRPGGRATRWSIEVVERGPLRGAVRFVRASAHVDHHPDDAAHAPAPAGSTSTPRWSGTSTTSS